MLYVVWMEAKVDVGKYPLLIFGLIKNLRQIQSWSIWPVSLAKLLCRMPGLPCFAARILGKPGATNVYVHSEHVH